MKLLKVYTVSLVSVETFTVFLPCYQYWPQQRDRHLYLQVLISIQPLFILFQPACTTLLPCYLSPLYHSASPPSVFLYIPPSFSFSLQPLFSLSSSSAHLCLFSAVSTYLAASKSEDKEVLRVEKKPKRHQHNK